MLSKKKQTRKKNESFLLTGYLYREIRYKELDTVFFEKWG